MSDHTVLVVGRGLIGASVADRLRADGHDVATVSTTPLAHAGHLSVDLDDPAGRERLRGHVDALRPARVILTHGPSDVTWIEANEQRAEAVHHGVAKLLAGSGVPTVLVSTDNVFDGSRGGHRPADPISPHNVYGRVKALAEQELLTGPNLALRVSLVYGWTGPAHRATYGQRCLQAAAAGEELEAPTDQSFTPVHIDDVSAVLAALCRVPELPTGIAHLAGPAELSRFDFATVAYRLTGADPALVRPVLRRDTLWASRPRHSSLACDDFGHLPGLAGWTPMTPADGLRQMLRTGPVVAV
ncbi:SDR family oxidoreductase [Amycolatopsis solani]|uniref:SDR family oxidoreductase n=1 Tax=Amycolatopsis solani TaxID=3028615 RepID=UPI0025AF97DC|nr:sugar nucleotide-binding protein [Amycolatopsis sp. MEP2-6]